MYNKKSNFSNIFKSLGILILMLSNNIEVSAQEFVSLVGIEVGYQRAGVSSKIAMSEYNYVEGKFALFTPEPTTTLGAGAAYHRHIMLNEKQTKQFYFGPSVKGVIGDSNAIGVGVDIGAMLLYKRINIGIDFNPTYFLDDILKFQPIYGVHLRWVNY